MTDRDHPFHNNCRPRAEADSPVNRPNQENRMPMQYVIALVNTTDDEVIGYWKADDEEETQNKSDAALFDSCDEASKIADSCNELWDLEEGEEFRVQEA